MCSDLSGKKEKGLSRKTGESEGASVAPLRLCNLLCTTDKL